MCGLSRSSLTTFPVQVKQAGAEINAHECWWISDLVDLHKFEPELFFNFCSKKLSKIRSNSSFPFWNQEFVWPLPQCFKLLAWPTRACCGSSLTWVLMPKLSQSVLDLAWHQSVRVWSGWWPLYQWAIRLGEWSGYECHHLALIIQSLLQVVLARGCCVPKQLASQGMTGALG